MKNNRLFKILYYILEKGKVTANELSDKFEVSVRTIYRDIDSISSTGIPIYTTQGKSGGIEIAKEFVLNKSLLTENEKNKHIISFSYFSSNEEETKHNAKPVRLLFKGQDWYLYAFCLLRNDFRYFKLSRIKKLEILSTNFEENFEDIILKKEFKYKNIVHLKVRFNRRAAFRVYDELNTNITEDEDGNLYTEIEIPNDYNLYNYVFSFGELVEVLEPEEIRIKIKKMINKIAQKYIT